MGVHYALENADLVYNLENLAVESILSRKGIPNATYKDINKYYAHCLNEHIHPYLFPGSLNTNQRKRATNLVPFPRIKFLSAALSEFKSKNYI